MSHQAARRPGPVRALVRTELRLLLREPLALFWSLAFPVISTAVLGLLAPAPQAGLGGLRLVDVYQPVLAAFAVTVLSVQSLPAVIATYRERGVLRRLATTPVGPQRLLAAQLAVNLGVELASAAGVVAVGCAGFHARLPGNPAGFLAALLVTAASTLAIGLLVGALAPTGRTANAAGGVLYVGMMASAGLWVPRALMPAGLRAVSAASPLGAAVRALQASQAGHWPPLSALLVPACCGALCAVLAVRYFRWQ